MSTALRELTPDGYNCNPIVKFEVDRLCAQAGLPQRDICRIDIDHGFAFFYEWLIHEDEHDYEWLIDDCHRKTVTPVFVTALQLAA